MSTEFDSQMEEEKFQTIRVKYKSAEDKKFPAMFTQLRQKVQNADQHLVTFRLLILITLNITTFYHLSSKASVSNHILNTTTHNPHRRHQENLRQKFTEMFTQYSQNCTTMTPQHHNTTAPPPHGTTSALHHFSAVAVRGFSSRKSSWRRKVS